MEPFLGMIMLWPCPRIPDGWVACNGQSLNIVEFQQLFSIVGDTYGGNGSTTFCVPDFRSRIPVGMGQGVGLTNHALGTNGGTEVVTLKQANLPAHTHTVVTPDPGITVTANVGLQVSDSQSDASVASGSSDMPGAGYAPGGGTPFDVYNYGAPTSMINLSNSINLTLAGSAASVNSYGASEPHNNLQPVVAMNYIMATTGVYPVRPN